MSFFLSYFVVLIQSRYDSLGGLVCVSSGEAVTLWYRFFSCLTSDQVEFVRLAFVGMILDGHAHVFFAGVAQRE